MEGGNKAVRCLWCYPNDFTKDIHKVFVAQMQKKIKQWEIGSLSPFWDFLHSILPPKCVGSLPAPLQAASAGFQTGSNALCLVYCWIPLPYIWLPNLLPSEEYSDRCREKKCRYPTLYPVVGCHVIRPLKTGILVKKKKKSPIFIPLLSVLFHILHSASSDPCWSSMQTVFWVYTTSFHTEVNHTWAKIGCSAYSHSLVSPIPQTDNSISACRMQTKNTCYSILLPRFPFYCGTTCLRRLRHFQILSNGLVDRRGWSRKSTIHVTAAEAFIQTSMCT